jgi:putative transposase
MSILKRYFEWGDLVFVTAVTHDRAPILTDSIDLLWPAIRRAVDGSGGCLVAWVVMPDHLHLIAGQGRSTMARIVQKFKLSYGSLYRKQHEIRSRKLWQRRYWDHMIRNEKDLKRHIDYIHINPVKHGLAERPIEWPFSSFRQNVTQGYYGNDWGCSEDLKLERNFGE